MVELAGIFGFYRLNSEVNTKDDLTIGCLLLKMQIVIALGTSGMLPRRAESLHVTAWQVQEATYLSCLKILRTPVETGSENVPLEWSL